MPPPGSANISTRTYICFIGAHPLPPETTIPYSPQLPHTNPLNALPPSEPTSTLVLTSPAATFVDVRILRPTLAEQKESVNEGARYERLEWAFAGKSSSYAINTPTTNTDTTTNKTSAPAAPTSKLTHSTWHHWLDSRYPLPYPPTTPIPEASYPIDEGDMYPLSPTQTLEHGHAFFTSPVPHIFDSGKELVYEELWDDVPILSTSPALTSNAIGKKHCVVLRIEDLSAGVRGVVIRLGQFCQGIMQVRDLTHVERWEFVVDGGKGGKAGGGSWKRTHKVGNQFLPCAVTFEPAGLVVGKVITYKEAVWAVEEVVEWE